MTTWTIGTIAFNLALGIANITAAVVFDMPAFMYLVPFNIIAAALPYFMGAK